MMRLVCLAGALMVLAPAPYRAQVAPRPAAAEPVFTTSRGAFFALSVSEAVGTTYEGTEREPVYRRWRAET